jgi:hypothetical protein
MVHIVVAMVEEAMVIVVVTAVVVVVDVIKLEACIDCRLFIYK